MSAETFLSIMGGHTLAVGCVLDYENMDSFKQAVNAYASSKLRDEDSFSLLNPISLASS